MNKLKPLTEITEQDMKTLFRHVFPDTPEDAVFEYSNGGVETGKVTYKNDLIVIFSGCVVFHHEIQERKSHCLNLGELFKLEQLGYDVFSEWRE